MVITKWDLNIVTIPIATLLNKSLHQCHLYLVNYMFSDPSVKIGMLIIMVTFHDSTVKCWNGATQIPCFSKRNGERLIMSSSPSLNTIRSLHCVLCKLEVLINSWNTNQGEELWSLNCKYQPFLCKNHPNKDAFLKPSYKSKGENIFVVCELPLMEWSPSYCFILLDKPEI